MDPEISNPTLALGDSMLFGQGVADDETFSSLLNMRGVAYMNLGVPGFDSWQEAALLEEILSRRWPKEVHLHFCANDLVRSPLPEMVSPHAGEQRPDKFKWIRHSAFLTLTGKTWNGKLDPHHIFRRALRSSDPPELQNWDELWALVSVPLVGIRDKCALEGVSLLVVIHPVPFQQERGVERYQSKLLPILQRYGIRYLDLKGYMNQECWIPYDGHYSNYGHKVVADEIEREFQSRSRRE